MNKRQKLVQAEFLNKESVIIERLQRVYEKSLDDITKKIKGHYASIQQITDQIETLDPDDPMIAVLESQRRSKVYQKQYQETLQKQVSAVLDKMRREEYTNINDYLDGCYNDGFIGSAFDLHGQGVPLIMPINQEAVVRAVQLESKISGKLYTKLGEDLPKLRRKIMAQVSRSMSTGMSYAQCAEALAAYSKTGHYNAVRIARTEGHRIQTTAAMDAMYQAKQRGADVVKQWDSALDRRTRQSHQYVDGELREMDDAFSNGLQYPGDPDGSAGEVINCRCALLQRARWALDDDELETLKERAEYFGLDKTENFEDFREKYLKAIEEEPLETIVDPLRLDRMSDDEFAAWKDRYYKQINGNVRLSDAEKKALYDYGEGGYSLLNAYGRYGADSDQFKRVLQMYGNPDIADVKRRFENVQNALQKFRLDDDIIVHRAVTNIDFITDDDSIEGLKKLKGKVITEDGFISTSFGYQSKFGGRSPRAVHMEFTLPKGTTGAYIDDFVSKNEREFLLGAGTKYRIIDGGERTVKELKFDFKSRQWIEIDKVERFLKVEVIPQTADIAETVVESITIDAFPAIFRKSKANKEAAQTLVDALNNADGLNADIRKLYTHIDDLPGTPHGKYKISYTAKDHALSRQVTWNGDFVEATLKIPKMTGDDLHGQLETAFHEIAHFIDMASGENQHMLTQSHRELSEIIAKTSGDIPDELREMFEKHDAAWDSMYDDIAAEYSEKRKALNDAVRKGEIPYKEYNKLWNASYREQEARADYEGRNIMGGGIGALTDIYDALSGGTHRDSGTVKYGHGSAYYKSIKKRNSEIFANYMSLSINRPDLVELLRKDKPELCEILDKLISEMAGGIK